MSDDEMRECIKCKKPHNLCWTDRLNNIITEIKYCQDCYFGEMYEIRLTDEQVVLEDDI